MEQGLYEKVVMIRRKDSENKKERENTKNITSKDNNQDQYVGLIFIMSGQKKILGHVNHISIKLYQTKFRGDDTKTYLIFRVPIGNEKTTRKVQLNPAAPVIKYHQKSSNSCCLSILASAFKYIFENRAAHSLVNSIGESFTLKTEKFNNTIHFANDIMKNRRKKKGEQNLRFNLTIWKKNDAFDILNDISEDVTLVQLTDSL